MAYETYTPMFSEVCQKVHNAKDKATKIKVLQRYRSEALEMFLKSALDPRIEWLLPEGEVPYLENEAPDGTGESSRLSAEVHRLYNFVQLNREDLGMPPVIGNQSLTRVKREMMFIQLLEGLNVEEAKIVLLAKDKTLHRKYKGLNANTVTQAYGWSDKFEPLNP